MTSRCKKARAARGYRERSEATAPFNDGFFLVDTGNMETFAAFGTVMVVVLVSIIVVCRLKLHPVQYLYLTYVTTIVSVPQP